MGCREILVRELAAMTDDELEEWLDGYLARNPGKRAMVEGALALISPPQTRREVIERLQEDEAAQASRRQNQRPM
jgi:hypothetical protein